MVVRHSQKASYQTQRLELGWALSCSRTRRAGVYLVQRRVSGWTSSDYRASENTLTLYFSRRDDWQQIIGDQKVTVEIPSREWTLKIGYEKTEDKYTVGVNEMCWSMLPEAPQTAFAHPMVTRSTEKYQYDESIRSHAFEFFVKGEKHVLVAQHIAKSQKVVVTLNKAKFEKAGIPLSETASIMPTTLSDDVSGIKATVDFDEEVGEFVFDINGEPWETHLFIDSSFDMDDMITKIINAQISINQKVVSEHGKEWQLVYHQNEIWAKIGEREPITSIKVENVRETTTATLNEMIALLALQENIPQEGIQELVFNKWKGLSEPLDDSVMRSLLGRCNSLTTLTFSNVLKQLAKQGAAIITVNSEIKHLDLDRCFNLAKDEGEGNVILSALVNSPSLP